jgi:hypothetical protein
MSVPDLSGSNRDISEIQPPLKVRVLHNTEKKTEPFSGTENQELSATDNLVPSVKRVLRDFDPRMTALARPRSNCTSKLQTHPLVREGATH